MQLMIEPNANARVPSASDEGVSAVSWGAAIAGAFVAAAFSLALVALGAGIGLISVSPWSTNNPSMTTFGILAAAWFIAVQLFSSGVGGYIAGRLRTRWVRVHTDEVYFRDTAHGLLVWAIGAVISALLLALAAGSAVSGAAHVAGVVAQAAGSATGDASSSRGEASSVGGVTSYFADMLFRSDRPGQTDQANAQPEAKLILERALASGNLPAADKAYLAQLVANRTSLSGPDAERRVTDVFGQAKGTIDQAANKAKEAADSARKTGVYVSLWAFISLLVGAFSASYMATVGGRTCDELPVVELTPRTVAG
jgi:hypothetical protein